MRQNRLECIFGVISFHAGVYFGKYQVEFNNYSKVYYCTTLNLDIQI